MKRRLCCLLITGTIIGMPSFLSIDANAKPTKGEPNPTSTTMMSIIEEERALPAPKLLKAEIVAPNQIQLTFDKDVDMKQGTKASNYWVQDMTNDKPQGVATIGKKDKMNANNSLTDKLVKITSKDNSAKMFVLTFSKEIPKGVEYSVIFNYSTGDKEAPNSGEQGRATFIIK